MDKKLDRWIRNAMRRDKRLAREARDIAKAYEFGGEGRHEKLELAENCLVRATSALRRQRR